MNITVYSTTSSAYCLTLKKYLEKNNIPYSEKLIDLDDNARVSVLKDSGGFMGVPFIVVTKDDGTKESIVGFDQNKLGQILELQ